MSKNAIIIIVLGLLIIGGGAWYFSSRSADSGMALQETMPTEEQAEGTVPSTDEVPVPVAQTVTVTYDGKTFSPASVTVRQGDTVTFVDSSTKPMWVASAMHPSHEVYDGTSRTAHCAAGYSGAPSFDQCKSSTESYSFTFTKTGTWKYHDHINASAVGQVVVQ